MTRNRRYTKDSVLRCIKEIGSNSPVSARDVGLHCNLSSIRTSYYLLLLCDEGLVEKTRITSPTRMNLWQYIGGEKDE